MCGFNFDKSQVQSYVAKADVNHDGKIDYSEFVPLAMELFSEHKSSNPAFDLAKYSVSDMEVKIRVS